MRLNFSGVGEDDIREGVRRIGEVVREQVELWSTLTGEGGATRGARSSARTNTRVPATPAAAPLADPELAKVLRLPRKRAG